MNGDPTTSTPTDRATSDPALLVPTPVTAAPVTAAPVTAAPVTAAPVTAAPVTVGEIAAFLRHLADLRVSGRSDDPAERAAFLHRKAELFTRLAADPALSITPLAPAGSTP